MLKAQSSLPIIPTNNINNVKSVHRQDTRSRTSSNNSENDNDSSDSDNSDNSNDSNGSSLNSINSTSTSTSTDRGVNKRDISSTARHRLSMQQPQPLGHLPVTEHDHGHDIADPLQTDRDHSRNEPPPPPSNTEGSGGVGGDHPTVEAHDVVDPLLAPQVKEESQTRKRQNHQFNDRSQPISLHSKQLHRHNTAPSVSTLSSLRQPIQHLTDMGPLEIDRENDSGVHLNHDSLHSDYHQPKHRQQNQKLNSIEATSLSDQNRPSASTLVSNRSSHSVETLGDEKIDPRGSEDQAITALSSARTTWSGDHPLLTDFTAEPDSFYDPDTTTLHTPESKKETRLILNHSHLRHKGHSMSVDQYPRTKPMAHEGVSFLASGSTTRRRRQARGDPDRSSGGTSTSTSTSISTGFGASLSSRDDHDKGAESIGKRVIIHQVAITDTLAGIALYYGIQVPILKKSNKLWTNDSIHTRKYLYIPVDECSVKQAGMTIDEGSNTVLLPQHAGILSTSPQHSRSGSATEHYGSASSSVPGSRRTTFLENEPLFPSSLPPPLPSAGGLLPGTGTAPMAISPRLGIWAESKSVIAPPVPSPTITTTTLSAESHGSTPLSPRTKMTSTTSKHSTSFSSTSGGGSVDGGGGGGSSGTRVIRRRSSIGVPFSEHLPNTVVVAPTMTHEALAARFKEMDLITLESKMSLGQEQELRTNPIHHRHRTSDLRQQAQRSRSASSSSNAGSRRASVDVETMDSTISNAAGVGAGVGGRLSRRTTILSMIGDEDGLTGMEGEEQPCEYDEPEEEEDEDAFVVYGRHQHIYMGDDDDDDKGGAATMDRRDLHSDLEVLQQPSQPTVRRQELITVPAGVLSFFPSPQHSKRLETPQSISRLQNRTDRYRYESSTHSSSSSSLSGGGRGTRTRDGGEQGRSPSSRGRKSIDEHTFQAPVPSSTRVHASAISNTSNNTATTTTTVRVKPAAGPKWSLVSDSIVEDILGAVRGPLEIVRRLYVSGFSFGEKKGSSSPSLFKGVYGQSSSSASGLGRRRSGGSQRRRVSSSSGGRRLGHGARTGSTGSGSAIELDTSVGNARPKFGSRRMPSSSSSLHGENVEGSLSTGVEGRRKSSVSSGGGPATAIGTPASSSTIPTTTGSLGSVRKRSLRSSKPVNHAALKALVNELDRDKKREETEREKGIKEPAPVSASTLSSTDPLGGSSAPTIRFME
ncbi:hypothetical protein BGZ93_007512 [Podila epicladia]|nr:hypothetical protein BGZ92_002480 [Podila epicladia]KAG0094184.1 hypothetical protein BGZ93_007512 [Podila epicladia]